MVHHSQFLSRKFEGHLPWPISASAVRKHAYFEENSAANTFLFLMARQRHYVYGKAESFFFIYSVAVVATCNIFVFLSPSIEYILS